MWSPTGDVQLDKRVARTLILSYGEEIACRNLHYLLSCCISPSSHRQHEGDDGLEERTRGGRDAVGDCHISICPKTCLAACILNGWVAASWVDGKRDEDETGM